MCCRLTVEAYDHAIAESVLLVAQFVLSTQAFGLNEWLREIPEEHALVAVSLRGGFEMRIAPSIDKYEQHFTKRVAAGVYFEVAAKYAEKVGGRIIQRSNMDKCLGPNRESERVVADYPSIPLRWESICPGFRAALLLDD